MKEIKVHIGFFIPSLRGGGAEKVFTILVNEFSKRDYKVDLILAQKEGTYLKDISKKVNIIDLKATRIIKSILPLVNYLKKEQPDILISTLSHANVAAIIAKILSRSRTKIVIRQAIHYRLSRNKLRIYLEGALLKKVDFVIAISKEVEKSFLENIKISKQRTKIIYNPVFSESIAENSKNEIPQYFPLNYKFRIILGIGRLSKQKDFPTLIKAFHSIKTDSMRLMILGEGRERKELENLVQELGLEEYVSMPGFVENPYAYLAKASVFVLSSKCEGLPNVLIEAMACGTTVVSTDCPGGPSEILEGGKYGKLVPVGDIAKLAEAITDSLKTPTEKELLISRAKCFSVERAINEYEKLFKELIKRDNSNNRCQNV